MKKINFFLFFAVFLAANIISSRFIYSQIFWNECTSGVTTSLNSVSGINSINIWICGSSGVVLKTTNGGYNWINFSGNGIPNNAELVNIFGVDNNIALTAGYIGQNTYVYRTSNGGANWSQVFNQFNGFLNAVWMNGALNGFMEGDPVGGRWSLWKTTNGGINWDSSGLKLYQTGAEAGYNNSLFVYGQMIWFGTNNSRIYYSSNFGINWIAGLIPELNTTAIAFDSTAINNGIAGGTNLYSTTNGGANWQKDSIPGTENITGGVVGSYFSNYSWVTRYNKTIYMSYFPYTIWSTQYTVASGNFTHITKSRQPMFGAGLLVAVRTNGGISRGNLFIEGVELISNNIPSTFTLHQNYPNPFNPQTKIRLEVPLLKMNKPGEVRGALIKIQVYDVTGKLIETLLDQITQPGVYEKTWNGSKYSSGVYFYRVIIADPLDNSVNYVATRKMVLMK